MKKSLAINFLISIISSSISIMIYENYFNNKNINDKNNFITLPKINSNPILGINSFKHSNFINIANKAINSVVSIKNYSSIINNQQYIDPFEFFFDFPQRNYRNLNPKNNQNISIGYGSGVVISSDGYIVTNNHVVDKADKIEITLNNQKNYIAKLIGKDSNSDIALLKIKGKNFSYLNFADSEKSQIGEWVLAIGNPFSLNSTVTAGIISAKGRNLNILKSKYPVESFIQTDAVINPGNSGGALINVNGDLIGINTAIASKSGNYIGYGFAIPSNLTRKIIEDIQKFGIVQRAYIGISVLDLSNEEQLDFYNQKNKTKIKPQEGVMVLKIVNNSSAKKSGIKKNDIIKYINKIPIKNYSDLALFIGNKRPGDKIKINVLRKKKEMNFIITLKNQEGNIKLNKHKKTNFSELLNSEFIPLGDSIKSKLNINYGVKIKEINNNYLNSIGLEEGDIILSINNKKIKKISDIDKILKGYIGDVSIKWINRYGQIYIRGFEMN